MTNTAIKGRVSHYPFLLPKVEVRYNVPSARGESCEFDLEVKIRPDIQQKDQGDDSRGSASKKNKGTTKNDVGRGRERI